MPWRDSKDAGKQAFSQGNYSEALSCYSEAITLLLASEEQGNRGSGRGHHTNEHQVLLSNVIACRLKIGGQDMANKAVEESKECIALNNKWSKAHIRLASAYVALGGHSNDACISLQRAMSLDRNNKVAREMLVKEMRQRNNRERTGESSTDEGGQEESSSQSNNGTYPTDETPQHHFPAPSAPPHPSTNNNNYDGVDVDDVEPPDAYHSLTIPQRIQHHFTELITWFHSQSDDIQTLLKIAFCFLILYVLLGGRFGLDYALGGDKNLGRRGNYNAGNAYDRYASSSTKNHYSSTAGSGYNDKTNSQNERYYSHYENENYYEPRGRRPNTSSFGMALYATDLASIHSKPCGCSISCKGVGASEGVGLDMGDFQGAWAGVGLDGEDLAGVGVGSIDYIPANDHVSLEYT
ncbi:hypothetical protein ACHAXR_008804 [Thalassiosira sp. AJA248-18]